MPKPQQTSVAFVVSTWAGLQAIGGIVMGLSILAGGPLRFSGPSLAVPHELAPWWVWGLAYLASGVLHGGAVLRRRRSVLATGLVLALMHGVLAGSVAWALTRSDVAAATGPANYFGLMVLTATGAALARLVFVNEAPACPAARRAT